jgi:acyl-CoA thioesterase YciA
MSDTPAAPRGELSIRTVAMPADTNPSGDMFGGWVMSQIDLAGALHAHRRVPGRTATVAVDGIVFHKPVFVGDQVSCYTETVRIGNTSISVRVEVWVQRRQDPSEILVTSATITYVHIDENRRPTPIPKG